MQATPPPLFNTCLLCNSPMLTDMPIYAKDKLTRCRNCGFVFARQIPTQQELITEYAKYARTRTLSPITANRYKQLLNQFEPYRKLNRLIDVGAGEGHFIEIAAQMQWITYATEFDPRAVELCRQKGATVQEGKLNADNYPSGFFDLIFSSEVMEHINNPIEEVQNFYQILRPGGLVYVTTPNFNALSHLLLKNRWNVFNYPEHLCYYTPQTITRLFTNHGFKLVKLQTTGISPTRLAASGGKLPVLGGNDEILRQATETKPLWQFAKFTANALLNLTRKGDTIKAWFEKES